METEVIPNSSSEETVERHRLPMAAEQSPACANCSTPLLGAHCYHCGQSRDGLARHLPGILSDFFSTLLALDSRVWRTVGPLLIRPGFLSREYFAGRRVRYVSPVRLFIFLSLAAVFLMRLAINTDGNIKIAELSEERFSKAATVTEVENLRAEMLAELDKASEKAPADPLAASGLVASSFDTARESISAAAAYRIAELNGEPPPKNTPVKWTSLEPALQPTCDRDGSCDKEVHSDVTFEGWPAQEWLEQKVDRMNANFKVALERPDRLKDAFLRNIPPVLIVLLPVFSLLLWLLYIYRRWLYMEHVIVALHSHAFLFLGLILLTLLSSLEVSLAASVPLASNTAGWLSTALVLWMPVYLLLMQKRVYGQGWPLTVCKYVVIGVLYSGLLGAGVLLTLLASLATL
ncbi:DUF3667 domain-containing protein [Microbulbifer yueqingensis]|uniref:DUF3667 domain-containing protein n=1 Tax=Microbulbifer yueqingensis TaxID=658219 RepID=A0A1G9CLY0_9GAMM|nr:DUF3667 domain-containing protein [Microbulbifer yueqingensis]SDK52485.1 Protein of unknown function [Microbulbifer yueqingensis]